MKKIIFLLALSISFAQCVTDDYEPVNYNANTPEINTPTNSGTNDGTTGTGTETGTGTGTGTGTETNPNNKTTYLGQVQPILNQLCVTCHNSVKHEEGVDLSSYSKAKSSIDKIIGSMSKQDDEVMPPSGKVADNLIQTMRDWKTDGLMEGSVSTGGTTGGTTTGGTTGGGTATSVTYAGIIQGILTQQCTACHGATNAAANLNLTTYTNAKNNIGIIINRIDLQNGQSGIMPTSGRMSEANIQAFKDWQIQGLLQ